MRGITWTGMGMGALLFAGAAWLGTGCTFMGEECICDSMYSWKEVTVLDAQAGLVDSATITVTRASDGKTLKIPDQNNQSLGKGKAMAFDDGIISQIPEGKPEMRIRVTATKAGKTGDQDFIISTTKCGCHFKVLAGRDTIIVR